MKRYSILVILAFAAIVTTHAQESALGFEFGYARTDFRTNSYIPTQDPNVLSTLALDGFKVGLVWDATYIKGFGSTLGLRYTYGTKMTDWVKDRDDQVFDYPRTKQRVNYNQLELFVDWQYKFEIASNTYIILTTGPSIQCGLSMNNTIYREEYDGHSSETKISRYDYSASDLNGTLRRINVTWGVGAGFQYKRLYLRGGYDFGLINPYGISNFNESAAILTDINTFYPEYNTPENPYTRYTKGRLDQWHIRIGFYFAQWGE